MNDKFVSQPIAKRLKEAGWVKGTEWCWYLWQTEPGEYNLRRFDSSFDLQETDYFAPDLLDITREIREMINNRQPIITDATIIIAYEKFKCILSQKNEVDEAAEIWIEMKKEGL